MFSDIPAGDGKLVNLFLRRRLTKSDIQVHHRLLETDTLKVQHKSTCTLYRFTQALVDRHIQEQPKSLVDRNVGSQNQIYRSTTGSWRLTPYRQESLVNRNVQVQHKHL